jgi:hypothetical protein
MNTTGFQHISKTEVCGRSWFAGALLLGALASGASVVRRPAPADAPSGSPPLSPPFRHGILHPRFDCDDSNVSPVRSQLHPPIVDSREWNNQPGSGQPRSASVTGGKSSSPLRVRKVHRAENDGCAAKR